MKLPRIFNPKVIACLAILYGVLYLLPVEGPALNVSYGILWIIGGILIWLRIRWASILIGLPAIADFFNDIISGIPEFEANIEKVASFTNWSKDIIPIAIILAMSFQGLILLSFIYHAIYSLLARNHD